VRRGGVDILSKVTTKGRCWWGGSSRTEGRGEDLLWESSGLDRKAGLAQSAKRGYHASEAPSGKGVQASVPAGELLLR